MRDCYAGTDGCKHVQILRMVRQFVFLLLMPSLTMTLWGQSQSSYLVDTQSTSTQDCTDPLLTSSTQCSSQSTGETDSLLTSQSSSTLQGESGTQSRKTDRNYSDTEQLSQKSATRKQAQQTLLPAEPLTEFQKFAATTTNQILPIYGAELFRSVPTTFAPLDNTPVPSDYVIGADDELRIRVWGQVNFQANLRVDRSGEVYLPQVGPVHVAGMAFSTIDAHLRGAIGRVYRNFELTVDIGQIRAIQVYVSGQARRPGVYTVSSLSTLVDALFASGGPSVQGSLRHIQLRRSGSEVTDFDLYGLLVKGDKSKDVKLQSGDVIFIPPAGSQVAVTGSVRNPAIYELKADESLADLLADAGGVTSVASKARVSIERIENHSDRHAMEVAYDAGGLATSLTDGDLIHVFSIVPKYNKTVTLRGNIANPGRFAWHSGMRVSELIPDKESLITRNYWWKRAQLGLPVADFEPTLGFANQRQPVDNHAITIKTSRSEGGSVSDQSGSGLDQSGSSQNQGSSLQNQGSSSQNQSGSSQNQSGSLQNQSGSLQNQTLNAQQRPGSSSLASSESTVSNRAWQSAQRTEISLFAPEIDWEYAVVERLDSETLKTTLIPFDLGKLVLQHEASQDLELQPGDIVSILSEADIRMPIAKQTKLVTLGGEFMHAGVYTVQSGETLRHLVERAGGLTPNAYLYGSEFTRESTRKVQQARIDEYVQSLSMRIQRSKLAIAASSTQNLASGTAAQSSEQDLLANLKQIRATGRIVLKFTPDSAGTSGIPDISMEDGDSFVVPHVPAIVNVIGAVYDQNSFLYTEGKRAGMYLQQAGGPTRDADQKYQFIIRADGEVVSNEMVKGLWGSDFHNLRMNPGDTIVIPEKTFKPSVLRGVIDWSQMFSQFALGAASLSVIN
jgi:protein involved in polysaccharide export with SLBB domain